MKYIYLATLWPSVMALCLLLTTWAGITIL